MGCSTLSKVIKSFVFLFFSRKIYFLSLDLHSADNTNDLNSLRICYDERLRVNATRV